MPKQPIVIEGALQSEIDFLLSRLSISAKREIAGVLFYEGLYRGQQVVICKTKMGEIAAAIATTVAIQAYQPAWILNQGTAGACCEALRTGDVIVGERVVYLSQYACREDHDTDALNPWKTEEYRTLDGEEISMQTDPRFLSWLRTLSFPINGALRLGALGSGDVWTVDREEILSHYRRFGVLCESMECTGAYLAANAQGVPLVSIRVISNNELLGEVYRPECAEIAGVCAIHVLDEWINLGENTPF